MFGKTIRVVTCSFSFITFTSSRYYNDDGGAGRRGSTSRRKRKQEEQSLDLRVLELREPTLSPLATDLWDNLTVVEDPADGLTLTCRVSPGARPRPELAWTLNGRRLEATINTTRVSLAEGGQVGRGGFFFYNSGDVLVAR